jgi:hypothetical protein
MEIALCTRRPRRTMDPRPVAGCLLLLFLCGCASMKGSSQKAGANAPVPQNTPAAEPVTAPAPERKESNADAGPSSSVNAGHPDVAPQAKPSATAPPAKPGAPAANRPVKPSNTPAAAHQSGIPATTPNEKAPTIDLAELEKRLRDTRAIGVFTKLSLKNQVDDLLGAFRTLYRGPSKRAPPELRERYDLLLLKVLSLLQDGDPQLAAAISSSREAIWGILADPDKFAKLQSM